MNFLKRFFYKRKHTKQKQIININDEHQFIFIHIPKNAGTSIRHTLSLPPTSHHTISEIKGILPEEEFLKYFKFAFVRNPWERFLSLYNYARLEESYYHSSIDPANAIYGKHLDYDLLKDISLRECAEHLIQGDLKHDRRWNHWRPQTNWVLDEKGECTVNFLGRVENFNRDIKFLAAKFSIKIDNYAQLNQSRDHSPYQDLYDNYSKNLIGDYYHQDISSFNYSF